MGSAYKWDSMEVRSRLENFLGEHAFKALEYHLKKVVDGDPYRDPETLRRGLKLVLGRGGELFFERMFSDWGLL